MKTKLKYVILYFEDDTVSRALYAEAFGLPAGFIHESGDDGECFHYSRTAPYFVDHASDRSVGVIRRTPFHVVEDPLRPLSARDRAISHKDRAAWGVGNVDAVLKMGECTAGFLAGNAPMDQVAATVGNDELTGAKNVLLGLSVGPVGAAARDHGIAHGNG